MLSHAPIFKIKEQIMQKFLTKENIIIIALVFWALIQSNYFATKLDLANVKLEMSEMKLELKQYTDTKNNDILKEIDKKFQILYDKIDRKYNGT